MIVFRYAFYGKGKLWLTYYRRGQSYEIETSRPESPRLYGTMLRSVASCGGGPGSRWTYFRSFKPYWPRPSNSMVSPGSAQHIYDWNHLRYEGPGPDDIYVSDVDDEYDDAGPMNLHWDHIGHVGVPCGYQDRRALRGSHRGTRSEASKYRRFTSWKQNQRDSRQDYRIWKSSYKDSTLRTHGDQNPKPLICPKSTAQIRLQSQASSFGNRANQLRNSCKDIAAPLPTGFDIHIATWNVEGLREVAKYDQVLSFLRHRNIHLLAVQETKSDSINTFNKSGWEILHSGASNAKHHGVGFFVSPSLRPHVHSFLAHSPRICEITVRTNPHPITVFSIYAPSTVEDSSEDVARKEFFWSQLDGIITDHKNSSHVVILGDFNSRLDSCIDPDQDHIGPHVWGKRQSIEDTDRDNALHLLHLLQSHLLLLPQTFVDVPNARKVTYKEMTTTTDVLEDFEVTDWTTLDYCATSHPIFPDITFKGSIFQQLVNTRHLPLLFTFRSTFSARLPLQAEPKLDYAKTSQFYGALEADLLASTGNNICSSPTTTEVLVAYTDGSCPNNRAVGPDNPAGWGFALYTSHTPFTSHIPVDEHWSSSYGRVKNTPIDEHAIVPLDGSNNTGEMRAIIELFDFILYYSHLPPGSTIEVFIDSTYVIRTLQGDQLPSTHHQLVEFSLQYFTALRTCYKVNLHKVSSHIGIPGNEFADSLAKRGVNSFGQLGRFSPPRTQPLIPPQIGYNSHIWNSKTPEEQSEFLKQLINKHKHLIPTLPVSPKKPWISDSTLALIDSFQSVTDLTVPELKAIRKRIKKSASKDKKPFISVNLQDDFHSSSIHQWRTARFIRKPFTPRSLNLFDIHGKLSAKHQRASVFAEYLSQKVWCAPSDTIPIPPSPSPTIDCDSPFTMAELNIVLRSLSRGRAPGPDSITTEMLKGAPHILKLFLLDHFNHCVATSSTPDSWALSEVVMLVKKIQNDTRDLSNYRPISLTNSMYKIFASLIQKRLSHHFDDRIRSTQFGFRAKRSTTQPIHIMRRILEVFERQQNSLHLLFLDWSKAFDSVSFHSIETALIHFGVPTALVKSILSLYSSPKFTVRDAGFSSELSSQTRGLRQGCPLSPYLFNFVLSHLFHDVEQSYVSQFGLLSGVINTPFPFWDLEYADDTVLLSNSSQQITRLLHLLQYHAHLRGLTLNLDKCAHLRLNSDSRIMYSPHFVSHCQCSHCHGHSPATLPVPLSDEVKYLGVFLDTSSNNKRNVSYRISQAVTASKLLKPLLGHKSLPPSWKLTVYRSVVQSILLYAMDSAQLTPAQLTKINHVHYKSLRRIFGIKSSFFHRVINPTSEDCSNQYLSGLAYNSRQVITPSQLYSQNRLTLLGHLFRHRDSLEFHSTFMPSGQYRYTRGPNRVGRPRLHWAESVMSEASNRLHHMESDEPPSHYEICHSFFAIPNISAVRSSHISSSLMWMDNTSLYRRILPNTQNRRSWAKLVHKPVSKPRLR